MRYFMHLAYRGANFHGWQEQPSDTTVQGTIQDALATILRTPIPIVGAGRTDTGVNAHMMIAHLDLPDDFDATRLDRLVHSVNSMVAPDIVVYSLTPVHPDAHARFDATRRTYRYFVATRRNPFTAPYVWHTPNPLDFDAMNEAANLLLGTRDFTSFSKLHTDVKTNICTVDRAAWTPCGAHTMMFEISADRFLRNMVRAVVGTLVDVGRGKSSPQHVANILLAKDRCAAGTSMPPQALFLWNIEYPYYTTPH